jgi:hypothetical protein
MADSETANENRNYYSNQNFNTANILATRLDTKPILDQIESYLRGEMIVETVENGMPAYNRVKIGDPKCNQLGIQTIMAYAQSIINSAVVQGNIKQDIWLQRNYWHRMELATAIVGSSEKFEIDDDDLNLMIDKVAFLIYFFTSRLIDNKERESYANYTQSQVTQIRDTQSGGWLSNLNPFGGKK